MGGGTTVLLTTQYLEEADRLADKVVVVDHGRVIAEGTPSRLKAELGATVFSITLADQVEAAGAARVLGDIWAKAPVIEGTTVEVTLDGGPRLATEALVALDRAGLVPVTLALREPSLDDVFLGLTGHRARVRSEVDTGTGEGPMAPGPVAPDPTADRTARTGACRRPRRCSGDRRCR